MVVQASIVGVFRTVLLIIGIIVLLRFIGQFMTAKRNMEEERRANSQKRKLQEEKSWKEKHLGKTRILRKGDRGSRDTEDVNYEEV